jgi:thiol-disulfide isomerase/thioredoxin
VVNPESAMSRLRASRRRLVILLAATVVLVAVVVIAVDAVSGHAGPARPLRVAKSFTLSELGHPGQHVSLAGLAGQPVVVNFFASWCPPCKRETPLLAKFYREHHGQIAVIGIDANDETPAALKFVRAQQVGYAVGVDPFPAKTTTSYGVLELPQTFFLNARHQIVRHVLGGLTSRELSSWAAASQGSGQSRN